MHMKLARLPLFAFGFACVLPLAAHAQWQWIDNAGKKVYSDQAPPPEIPEKNILKRNGAAAAPRVTFNQPPTTDAPAVAANGDKPAAVKPTGVDKELEEKTKKAEEAEKAKQAAEAQKVAQAKTDNCNRARQSKATFDSGIRVARLNAQGEREIMDDKGRAEEQKRLQTVIASDCK
jgi:hypothetical protein